MTTPNNPRPHLVPTSSQPGDDLPNVTSSLVPYPSRGRGHTEAVDDTTNNTPPARPRDDLNPPGSVWLLTHRTWPAWTAVHELLSDHAWHPVEDVTDLMRQAANLAPRTIENHLHSASARRWINLRGGKVRMREDFAHLLDGVR